MSYSVDSVIERVRKLLNLADRSDKPGEVESAQAAAQRLITKYQLDHIVEFKTDPHGVIEFRLPIDGKYIIDKAILLNIISSNNFCKVLRGADFCVIYGYESDIKLVVALYNLLCDHMMSEMGSKLPEAKNSVGKAFKSSEWIKGFLTGYCVTIGERLRQSFDETVREAGTGIIPYVRDKQHAIQRYYEGVPRSRDEKKRQVNTATVGYKDGAISAREANIS
jgi:hypothetical protein